VARVLIAHATREGHTAKLAEHMRATLAAGGHEVEVADLGAGAAEVTDGVDVVIAGGPLHKGAYPSELADFAKANRARLEELGASCFTEIGRAHV